MDINNYKILQIFKTKKVKKLLEKIELNGNVLLSMHKSLYFFVEKIIQQQNQ